MKVNIDDKKTGELKKRRENKMGKVDLADKIKRMSVIAKFDRKAKKLVFQSIKLLKTKGAKPEVRTMTLNHRAIQDLKGTKDYNLFRDKLNKKYKIPEALWVDSQAKKNGRTKNTRYDGVCNAGASALDMRHFITSVNREIKNKKLAKVKVKKVSKKK